MRNIVLDRIERNDNSIYYHYHVSPDIARYFKGGPIFLSLPYNLDNVPDSILSIPFVSSFSPISWLLDISLWVDEIDRTYFYALKDLKVAYQEIHYDFPFKGRLVPSKIISNSIHESDKAILLYGGGVDCYSSFLRHRDEIVEIVNINGWLEDQNQIDSVDESDRAMTQAFGEHMSVKATHIRSNLLDVFNLKSIDNYFAKKVGVGHWYGFLHPMFFIGCAIPLAWQNGLARIIIASSNTKGQNNVCASDVTTDSLHKFAVNGEVIHDGFELNRQEKIRQIVSHNKTQDRIFPLHVCSFHDSNCCECEKCFRTVISLIAEGEDPRKYGFNIQRPMKEHWIDVMDRRLGLWGIGLEKRTYWPYTKARMIENYSEIEDKEFVDWFLNYDFDKQYSLKKREYYKANLFSILKRKITGK